MDPSLAPFLAEVWTLVKAAGAVLCVAFGYLWRLERGERLQCHAALIQMVEDHRKEKEAITDRAVSAMNSVAQVVAGMKELIQTGRAHP